MLSDGGEKEDEADDSTQKGHQLDPVVRLGVGHREHPEKQQRKPV
ncbi:hypothetical protein LBWT_X4360 (plasmid) [Leptolyngbya boryana IAM M-101]|nr:hypothetical protein LBWT_X4360 [Leptolyngbya boryana IAM M-101]BAS66712.1 hypothetical protein LBDG_X4360 [Leptolyngbya boryana dg5]